MPLCVSFWVMYYASILSVGTASYCSLALLELSSLIFKVPGVELLKAHEVMLTCFSNQMLWWLIFPVCIPSAQDASYGIWSSRLFVLQYSSQFWLVSLGVCFPSLSLPLLPFLINCRRSGMPVFMPSSKLLYRCSCCFGVSVVQGGLRILLLCHLLQSRNNDILIYNIA